MKQGETKISAAVSVKEILFFPPHSSPFDYFVRRLLLCMSDPLSSSQRNKGLPVVDELAQERIAALREKEEEITRDVTRPGSVTVWTGNQRESSALPFY